MSAWQQLLLQQYYLLRVQEAEKYFASEKGEFQAQEYDWQNVYVGACAVMWQSTGEQRYPLLP